MPFVIPDSKKTAEGRLAYCVAAQEKLRRRHNEQALALGPAEMARWIKGSFQPYSLGLAAELIKSRKEVEESLGASGEELGVSKGQVTFPPGNTQWSDQYALMWAAQRRLAPEDATERARVIGEQLGIHKLAPPPDLLDEVVLPALDATAQVTDPYEDFTSYTEVDPGSDISVSSSSIAITALPCNLDARVYKDKGAGHFGNSFNHLVENRVTGYSGGTPQTAFWAVANALDDVLGWYNNYNEAVAAYRQPNLSRLTLYEYEARDSEYASVSNTTWYYCQAVRSSTTLVLYIRTGSHTGTLVDTLSVTLPSARTYRYVFAVNNRNDATAYTYTGDVQNLDLQEAVPISRRRRLICGAAS